MIFANEWRLARGRYLDYFLHFWGLGSKRGNVKPSYLMEIHSEIGTLFHILVHHGPNTGEIVMKFAVYTVYNICKRMNGARGRYLDYFLHFRGLESKRGNVKPSYLIEIHSEIATLLHILVHHGPNTGQIVMKFAVYTVYNICKRMEGGQRPLSRLWFDITAFAFKAPKVQEVVEITASGPPPIVCKYYKLYIQQIS